MMWHGHLAMAVASAEVTEPLAPHPLGPVASVAAWCAIVGICGLASDLDHRDGKLSHSLGPITWVLCRLLIKISKAVYFMTRGPRDYQHTNGHRAFTHTPVFAVLAGAGAWLAVPAPYSWFVGLAVTQGILAHLAGDCCTNSGVPLLWPIMIKGRRWGHYGIPKALRFETGGPVGEPIMTLAMYGLCAVVPIAWLMVGVRLWAA